MSATDTIATFKVPTPEPDLYPFCCVREQGRALILVRGKNAILINSPQAKQAASRAQAHIPGYQNNGIEPLGGAYCVDVTTGKFMTEMPKLKEGDPLPDNIRYERKFRLNNAL